MSDKPTMSERIAELHAAADWVDEFATHPTMVHRLCEACLNPVWLYQGRHSGKWFWAHIGLTGCKYDTGCAVMFDTKQQAETAQEIWKEIKE